MWTLILTSIISNLPVKEKILRDQLPQDHPIDLLPGS